MAEKRLCESALAVLDKAAGTLNAQDDASARDLLLVLAKRYLAKAKLDDARRNLNTYLKPTTATVDESVGDVQAQHRTRLLTAAEVVARAGLLSDALDYLGRWADAPRRQQTERTITVPLLVQLDRLLADLSPGKRFEVLREWTLPAAGRHVLRSVGGVAPVDLGPPPEFNALGVSTADGVISTAGILIDAARGTGKLDELTVELRQAAQDNVENASHLWLLAEIASGRGHALEDEIRKALAPPDENDTTNKGRPPPVDWQRFLLIRACFGDKQIAHIGEQAAHDTFSPAHGAVQQPIEDGLLRMLAARNARQDALRLHPCSRCATGCPPPTIMRPLILPCGESRTETRDA